jgi:hypothetical protein
VCEMNSRGLGQIHLRAGPVEDVSGLQEKMRWVFPALIPELKMEIEHKM